MAKTPEFPFDPSLIAAFFKDNDLSRFFPQNTMPDMDPMAVMEAQKKNMDALIEANKTAAAGYQDLFKKQLAAFEATVLAAKDHAETMGSGTSQSTVENQGEFVKSALENAMANMTALAHDAQKANVDAYAVVAERVEENVRELQELARKFTGS